MIKPPYRCAGLTLLTVFATAALGANPQVFPKDGDVVFRAGSCKPELVQVSADGGKTLLNKGACATWGLSEEQIARMHQAGACVVFVDYNNVTMEEIHDLDCETQPEKK